MVRPPPLNIGLGTTLEVWSSYTPRKLPNRAQDSKDEDSSFKIQELAVIYPILFGL